MNRRRQDRELEADLTAVLAGQFPGIEVEVAHNQRWNRMCATFRWGGFTALLPEERFHRLVKVIPEKLREARMRGFAWLELAPDEALDAFLKLPRSEDVADQEVDIYAGLEEAGFFESLAEALGTSAGNRCREDFGQAEAVLSAKGFSMAQICDAKLVFIRYGAYCDCQVLEAAQPALAELHTTAA
jgi:hypothetical protein